MLEKQQIETYKNDGVLVIDDLFTLEEISELMTAIENCSHVQDHLRSDPHGFKFHLLEITTMHPVFLKYACHPKIVSKIIPLLGKDIQLQHSKLTAKMPGETKGHIPWHQDFAYIPHPNTHLLTVMICLVDFTIENGCMKMIQGGHKLGLLNHREENGLESLSGCSDSWALEDMSKIIDITPKKGGISIHHCLMPHSSSDNMSNAPRFSLAYHYRARHALQIADKVWEDTGLVVAGKDNEQPLDIHFEAMQIPLLKSIHRYSDNPYGTAFNQIGNSVKSRRIMSPFYKAASTRECGDSSFVNLFHNTTQDI